MLYFLKTPTNHVLLGQASGSYMLLNATAGNPGDIGVLVSHQIVSTGPLCAISFWYNMKGSGVGKLQVRRAYKLTSPELIPLVAKHRLQS